MKRFVSGFPIFFTAASLLAQDATATPRNSTEDAAAVAGAAGIGAACCFMYFLCIAVGLAVYIFTAIWIMRDAKSRQSENAQLVTVLGWIPFTWWIGLIVHLVTRPKGNLVPCPNCQKKRLEGSAICPHCGQP